MTQSNTVLLPFLVCAWLATSNAYASPQDATEIYQSAVQLYRNGKYSEALAKFEEAYALDKDSDLLYNIAMCQERLSRRREAIASFQSYLTVATEPAVKREVEGRIAKLQNELATAPPAEPEGGSKPPANRRLTDTGASPKVGQSTQWLEGVLTITPAASALTLASGVPNTTCEQRAWYELTPVRAFAGALQVGAQPSAKGASDASPHAVYRWRSSEPESVIDLLPRMNEPTLAQQHEGRIKELLTKKSTSTALNVTSIVLSVGSLGATIPGLVTKNDASIPLLITGGVMLTAGLSLAIAAIAAAPSEQQRSYAETRKYLFLPDEDDMQAVQRGVTSLNLQTREQCVRPSAVTTRAGAAARSTWP